MLPIKKAIVLAGGKGTRLAPLTDNIPKVLLSLNGKPIAEHVIDILKKAGISEIILSTGYMAEKVKDYFGDGSKFGIKITYAEEKEPMGTASPLLLLPKFEETFFMVNGDNLFNLDFDKMYELHKRNNAAATIALTQIPKENVVSFGVAKLDGEKIIEFIEKPNTEQAPSTWINSGYYILEPEVFDIIEGKSFAMVENDLFPILAAKGKLFGYKDNGQWFDTGDLERYEQVKKEWKGVL